MTTAYPEWWHREQKPWNPEDIPTLPSWWVWTGGYYELDGDHTYLMNWNLNKDSVVMDVGAYRGVWVSQMIEKYPCHYWCVEPSPYSFDALKKTIGDYAKAHLFNFALWTEDAKGTLCDIQRDGASLFGTTEPKAEVELVDVVRFFSENKIGNVDLMSMNIEGAEFYLLPYFVKTGLIGRIKNLMIQWHFDTRGLYSRRRVWQIRETLVPTHKMAWNLGAWECWERKMQ